MSCQNCRRFDFEPHGKQQDTIQLLDVLISTWVRQFAHTVVRETWCVACWDAARRGYGRGQWTERGRVFRGCERRRVSLIGGGHERV